MKAVRPDITSNGIRYFKMTSVASQHVREGGGRKEGNDPVSMPGTRRKW